MILCTWDRDSFSSDVYVRKDADGFYIHVARTRYVGEAPKAIHYTMIPREPGKARAKAIDAFCDQAKALMRWMIATPQIPLGGEHAGKVFVEKDWDDCYECLRWLRDVGYRVPESALATLRYRRDLERAVAEPEALAA